MANKLSSFFGVSSLRVPTEKGNAQRKANKLSTFFILSSLHSWLIDAPVLNRKPHKS